MRRLGGVLCIVFCMAAGSCSDRKPGRVTGSIVGAGASFPAPLYEKWIASYRAAHPESRIGYQTLGSGAGIQMFTDSRVDFGASDAAMTDAEIASASGGVLLFPVTAGSVVLCYNIPGLTEPLKLSREVYAGIFLGTITTWNDPKIATDNKNAKLPDLKITTVQRSGASGTTFAFTKHLSAISDGWKKGPGVGLSVQWPTGVRVLGSDGIAEHIQQTPGVIGYLGYNSALKHKLAMASLKNKAGEFVAPSVESGQAALASVEMTDDTRVWIPDPDGKASYPIVTFTWILTRKKYSDASAATLLKDFLKYGLTDGQKESAPLGYIPLPPNVLEKVLKRVEAIGS